MNIMTIVAICFLILESMNVITLYFFPGSRYANGVGVFNAWEKSKADPEIHDFVKYLVTWVAGTKLIFILLLVVILFFADDRTLAVAGFTLATSIASFFWRLFPLIRRMDRADQIQPRNYSGTLGWIIAAFIVIFIMAASATLLG